MAHSNGSKSNLTIETQNNQVVNNLNSEMSNNTDDSLTVNKKKKKRKKKKSNDEDEESHSITNINDYDTIPEFIAAEAKALLLKAQADKQMQEERMSRDKETKVVTEQRVEAMSTRNQELQDIRTQVQQECAAKARDLEKQRWRDERRLKLYHLIADVERLERLRIREVDLNLPSQEEDLIGLLNELAKLENEDYFDEGGGVIYSSSSKEVLDDGDMYDIDEDDEKWRILLTGEKKPREINQVPGQHKQQEQEHQHQNEEELRVEEGVREKDATLKQSEGDPSHQISDGLHIAALMTLKDDTENINCDNNGEEIIINSSIEEQQTESRETEEPCTDCDDLSTVTPSTEVDTGVRASCDEENILADRSNQHNDKECIDSKTIAAPDNKDSSLASSENIDKEEMSPTATDDDDIADKEEIDRLRLVMKKKLLVDVGSSSDGTLTNVIA